MTVREENRRSFLKTLATATGAVVLAPVVQACTGETTSERASAGGPTSGSESPLQALPERLPANWDPIAFNRDRGNAGAIPESYRNEINGPDGVTKHLGKHLPYLPAVDASMVPAGYVAIMWGDASAGYAQHPNAAPSPENDGQGHWFNWIRVRKSVDGYAEERESVYSVWPGDESTGFAVLGGDDITADSGKNTIYLVALPADVAPGDTVRIHAHCLTHGEYVDFVTIPA